MHLSSIEGKEFDYFLAFHKLISDEIARMKPIAPVAKGEYCMYGILDKSPYVEPRLTPKYNPKAKQMKRIPTKRPKSCIRIIQSISIYV
jgi:hypothetical protein